MILDIIILGAFLSWLLYRVIKKKPDGPTTLYLIITLAIIRELIILITIKYF